MSTPNKDRIRKLVHALRTTKRKQGMGKLATYLTPNQKDFCCLGIACEVAIADGLNLTREKRGSAEAVVRYINGADDKDTSTSMLPEVVARWYGFSDIDPALIDEAGERSFATELNDRAKYDFKRIANAFERTYLSDQSE